MAFMLLFLVSCDDRLELDEFTSDGCSLFPDSSWLIDGDWSSCCFEHDIAYWQGGSEEQRLVADQELQRCVLEKTGNETLTKIMFEGVRFGGSPIYYTWYRWGYGWGYGRGYQPLNKGEKTAVGRKLKDFFEQSNNTVRGGKL